MGDCGYFTPISGVVSPYSQQVFSDARPPWRGSNGPANCDRSWPVMPRRSWLLNGELLVEETYIPKTNMTMEKQQLEDGATCVDSDQGSSQITFLPSSRSNTVKFTFATFRISKNKKRWVFSGFSWTNGFFQAHMLHGTGILTYIYHKSIVNVGKYSIHGSDGQGCLKTHGPDGIPFEKKRVRKNLQRFFQASKKNAGCWPYVIREISQNYLTFASSLIPPAKKNGNLMTPGKRNHYRFTAFSFDNQPQLYKRRQRNPQPYMSSDSKPWYDGSMGRTVFLPTWMGDSYGKLEGRKKPQNEQWQKCRFSKFSKSRFFHHPLLPSVSNCWQKRQGRKWPPPQGSSCDSYQLPAGESAAEKTRKHSTMPYEAQIYLKTYRMIDD